VTEKGERGDARIVLARTAPADEKGKKVAWKA
jgi:hypothetical protein